MSEEIWKPVVGFEGAYEVSNMGRVRSLDRTIICGNGVRKFYRGRVLRPGPRPSGHLTVVVGSRTQNVHALVLRAFVGPRPDNACARHLDGDEKNNKDTNLAWASWAENCQDRKHHKGWKTKILTPSTAKEVKEMLRAGSTYGPIAERFGISKSTVGAIAAGRFHKDVT